MNRRLLRSSAGLVLVFAVPALAAIAVDPAASEAQLTAVTVTYTTIHQFAGVALGEHLGQTLLAVWTACVSLAILRSRVAPRILGWVGLALVPAWIVGQSELLATVIPNFPVVEITPIAFMAWEIWALALGLVWAFRRG